MRRLLIYLLLVYNLKFLLGQIEYYPLDVDKYGFINYKKNKIFFQKDSTKFEDLFCKIDTLLKEGTNQVKIVHIGGSHLQADVYTQQLRKRFYNLQNGLSGSRGFIFPYKLAKTNNPHNFKVNYSGKWEYCRNVKKNLKCNIGLSGITVTTQDTSASLSIKLNNDSAIYFDFNNLKIFYEYDSSCFELVIEPSETIIKSIRNENFGYTEFCFNTFLDSVKISVKKEDSIQNNFTLYGLYFDNSDAGIVYNAIGVNGAKLNSYIECELFKPHLSAINPDLIIISIGTNDAYTRRFNTKKYKTDYLHLLNIIKNASPNSAVLLTVPNDSYLYRRYINRNTEKVKNIIFEISKINGYGVWDFYTIMGGLNSSYIWYKNGLMKTDKIHFNHRGYLLKGDLFFNAFLKSYNNHLNSLNTD